MNPPNRMPLNRASTEVYTNPYICIADREQNSAVFDEKRTFCAEICSCRVNNAHNPGVHRVRSNIYIVIFYIVYTIYCISVYSRKRGVPYRGVGVIGIVGQR